jgi:hypothetical protein
VRLEGLEQLKNPMTSPGIDPATFRLLDLDTIFITVLAAENLLLLNV